MVGLGKTTPEDLQVAIDQAISSGWTRDEIESLVAGRIVTLNELASETLVGVATPKDEGVVIYDELPPGLIDLPTASRKYGVKNATMRYWISKGHIKLAGRKKAPAAGGGYAVVCEDKLFDYIKAPRNKGGRPKKPK